MKIAFLGDVAMFGHFQNEELSPNFDVSELQEHLADFDYVVCNLEAPLTNSKKRNGSKSAYVSSDVRNVTLLRKLGVNIVCLANNHIYDFGAKGVFDTISELDSHGVKYFGIDGKFLEVEHEGEVVLFSGFCSFDTNPSYKRLMDSLSDDGLNCATFANISKQLEYAKNKGIFSVLSLHSGMENISVPSPTLLKFVRGYLSRYSSFLYGHHPHVIQGTEKIGDCLAAYSLGNCMFDDIPDYRNGKPLVVQKEKNKTSFIMEMEIKNGKLVGNKSVPFHFGNNGFILNSEIARDYLNKANDLLLLNYEEIESVRKNEILSIKEIRSSQRDFYWFLSRIKIDTIIRVFMNKYNSFLYKLLFKNKVDNFG